MTLIPMYDRVVLRRKEAAEETSSGLFIPTSAQEVSNVAEVVAVGHGRLNENTGETVPLKVEVGMEVLLGKWSGDEVKVDGEAYLIVREGDILAIVG